MKRRSLLLAMAAAMTLSGCDLNEPIALSISEILQIVADKLGGGTPNPNPGPQTPQNVAITVSPKDIQLGLGATYGLACTVTGATDTGCNWAVTEAGGGSITTAGVYTAPSTAGVFHVVATSKADATKSDTATITVAAVTASGKPWVTGYYAGWFWDQWYPPQQVDMTAMTHFVFGRVAPGAGSLGGAAGTIVKGAGTAHTAKLSPDGVRSVEDYLIKKAHDSGAKALLMLGGDGSDGIGFNKSTTDALRPTFVKNLVDYMVAHDYDGVDVDWENGLNGGPEAGGVSGAESQRRLKALISEIRVEAAKRPRYSTPATKALVTFPGYAVSINFLEPGGKVSQWQADVANMVDQYNLMSYGVGMTWSGGGWSSWFSTPIFGASGTTPYDLDSSIKAYVATGVPRSKMGIGIGFYGIYYGPGITGPRQPTENESIYEIQDVALAYSELVRKGYLSHGTLKWDEQARSSYRVYGSGGYVPSNDPNSSPAGYLSFEDERSIAAKAEWVRSTGVGGTIIWTINYGYLSSSKTNPLLAAVKKGFIQ